ncbi:MAG: hypothetical protein ACOC5M_00575 [Chloroflexota bacterium]
MKYMRFVVPVGLAAAVAIVVAVNFGGGGLSADEVLADAANSGETITSVRYTIDGTEWNGDEGDREAHAEAAIEAGAGISQRTTWSDGEFEEQIVIGTTRYSRNDPDGDWDVGTNADVALTSLADVVRRHAQRSFGEARIVGEERIDGTETIHISVETDMTAKATHIWGTSTPPGGEIPRQQFESGEQTIEYWVGKQDDIVRRIGITEEFPGVGSEPAYGSSYEINFHDFNNAKVEAPDVGS